MSSRTGRRLSEINGWLQTVLLCVGVAGVFLAIGRKDADLGVLKTTSAQLQSTMLELVKSDVRHGVQIDGAERRLNVIELALQRLLAGDRNKVATGLGAGL